VLLIALEQNLILPKILLHPVSHHGVQLLVPPPMVQPPQRIAEYQTVKAAQHPVDLVPVLVDKLLHGVLLALRADDLDFNDTIVQSENAHSVNALFAAKPHCADDVAILQRPVGLSKGRELLKHASQCRHVDTESEIAQDLIAHRHEGLGAL